MSLTKKIDFALIINVKNANPNGLAFSLDILRGLGIAHRE